MPGESDNDPDPEEPGMSDNEPPPGVWEDTIG